MQEQANERGVNLSEIERLTQRAHDVSASVSLWNRWYMIAVAVTVVLAAGVFVTQFVASRRSTELSGIQDALIAEKDRISKIESKDKDGKIADANKAAGDANDRAKSAEKGAADANERAERLSLETEELRKTNLATEATIETERQKRVALAASLLPRDFFDQSVAINLLAKFPQMPVVLVYVDESEPRHAAEQIAFVFNMLRWPYSRLRVHETFINSGVTVGMGTKHSPEESAEFLRKRTEGREVSAAIVAGLQNSSIEAKEGFAAGDAEVPFNTLVVSVGLKPNREAEEALKELGNPRSRAPLTAGLPGAGNFFGSSRVSIPERAPNPPTSSKP